MTNTWKNARTVADLGGLMADWLEGRIPTWPGYGAVRPEQETHHLIPTLAASCRAGLVTTNSQPGERPTRGYDGRLWRQRAAVDGWIADTRLLNRIHAQAARAGITVISNRPGAKSHPGLVVTEADGEPMTAFGWTPGHRRLIASVWPGISSHATRDLRSATYLARIDPEWGRDDRLWPTLTRAI